MSTAVEPDVAPPGRSADTSERNWGELVMTGLLFVLGAYLIIDAGTITVPGSANTVGPRFFPYLVGGATVAVALALGIGILRGDRGPAEEGEDIDPDASTSWRSVGIIAVAFLAHALLINVIGWPLAVTSMFGVVAWALGARGIIRPLLAGADRLGDHLADLRQGAGGAAARRHPARARDELVLTPWTPSNSCCRGSATR